MSDPKVYEPATPGQLAAIREHVARELESFVLWPISAVDACGRLLVERDRLNESNAELAAEVNRLAKIMLATHPEAEPHDRPTLTIVTHSDDQLRTDWDGDGDIVSYPPDESSVEITTPGGEVLSVETEWDCGWRTTVTAPVGCTARTVDANGATIVDDDEEDEDA